MPILKLFVGGGVPDAPADFAWLQFGVLDGIYDGVVGRGLDPSFAILLLLKVARGVEDAAPYTRPYGGCRGEQCSPAKISRCRKIPRADMESAPTNYQKAATKNRNREPPNCRVLAPGRGQSVRSWILKGALAKRSRKARTQAPLSRASRAIGSSGTLFASFWGSKRKDYRAEAH